ncbi:unnamed protein product [Camellia sinensis]
MKTEESDSMVQNALKSLCRNYGWSYGVFWRFDQRNSLLLTMEDAYYEEKMGIVIDNMLLQVHMLGNGVVGQTAFTKRHRWMFLDAHCGGQNRVGSTENWDMFQDDSEIHCQFASGIETITVISVDPRGVVQFGSTRKIPERMEFVDQTRRLFREIENGNTFILPENIPSSSNGEVYGRSGLFASLISSGNSFTGLKPIGASSENYMGTICSSTDLPRLSPFTSDHTRKNSSHLGNQLRMASAEIPFKLSNKSSFRLQQPLSQSTTYFDHSAAQSPCISTWSSGHSSLTSIGQQLPSQTRFLEASPVSSGLNGAEVLVKIPVNHPSYSMQSSITNIFNSDGDNNFLNDYSLGNDMFDGLGVDFEHGQAENFLDDILIPAVSGGHLDFSTTDASESISERRVGSMVGPQEMLFSKLGLQKFLDGIGGSSNSSASSGLEDELSSESKRKLGNCSVSGDQMQSTSPPYFGENMNSLQPIHNLDRSCTLEPKKEAIPKSEGGSWIGDSYSFTCGSSVVSQPKKSKGSIKVAKKSAKPGSRPKPKDRQQIQECIAELRKLIPNGMKMSIDSLLAQTINHMLFLQSVTKHAEKLKHAEERKENEAVLQDCSSSGGFNATWACAVGAQTMVDPVDVKDLSLPGQKLVQMLCEEKGFFLEIIDIIQGFGLTILKGVMEVRGNKIWACFFVEAEANRHVTKQEIYVSLHQFLYQKATSEINATNQLANILNGIDYAIHQLPSNL